MWCWQLIWLPICKSGCRSDITAVSQEGVHFGNFEFFSLATLERQIVFNLALHFTDWSI